MAVATQWNVVQRMVQRKSKGLLDREEFESFAMTWLYELVTEYQATTNNPPNLPLMVNYCYLYYIRQRDAKDADFNLGYDTAILSRCDDPALAAQVSLDTEAFIGVLNAKQSRVLTLTLQGYGTAEIATLLRLTPGRVSQIRTEVQRSACEFLAAYC